MGGGAARAQGRRPRGVPERQKKAKQFRRRRRRRDRERQRSEIQAPTVARPLEEFGLDELLSGKRLTAVRDSGSDVCVISMEEARRLELAVGPLGDVPPELGQAASGSTMRVLGAVDVLLAVPGYDTAVRTKAAVVEGLWRPFVLGRNVLEAMATVTKQTEVAGASGNSLHPSVLGVSASTLREGAPAFLSRAIRAPSRSGASHAASFKQLVEVRVRVDESALRGANGDRVDSIEGTFEPGEGRHVKGRFARAHVVAAVDYSAPPTKGMRDLVFITEFVTAVHAGHAQELVPKGARVGTFSMARPSVVLSVPEEGSREAELQRLLASATGAPSALAEQVALRTLADSKLLVSREDKEQAASAIRSIPFVEDLEEAARAKVSPFEILLVPDARVVTRRNYSRSVTDDEFAEEQIRKWLRSGTIRESSSPWSSPIVVAHHPRTGKLRLCVDYRALNAMTIPDAYLMPRIDDIQRALKGSKVFSKIDLAQGFNQYAMSSAASRMTAFSGPRGGHFEFVGSPFGLRNLPAAFQRFMDGVLGDMAWQRAAVYVDDVVVFSKSVSDHHTHLRELASRFQQYGVVARASKCAFYLREVEFVGFVFDGESIGVAPGKVKAVVECAPPRSPAELRRFMGLMGQFRTHVKDYAAIAAPLEAMKGVKSEVRFDMGNGSAGWKAFHQLKSALLEVPRLAIPDMNRPFEAYQDSSYWATGLCLCQRAEDGTLRPVGFYSKAFDKKQLSWTMPRKEAWGLRHFVAEKLSYYFSSPLQHTVYVDAKGSAALCSPTIKDPMLLRIALALQHFNLRIQLISGAHNLADPLTRPPFVSAPVDAAIAELKEQLNPLASHPGWKEAMAAGTAGARARHASPAATVAATSAGAKGGNGKKKVASGGNAEAGAQAAIPRLTIEPFTLEQLKEAQQQDELLQKGAAFVLGGRRWSQRPHRQEGEEDADWKQRQEAWKAERKGERKLRRLTSGWRQVDGIWVRVTVADAKAGRGGSWIVPAALQGAALDKAHEGAVAGVHLGAHGPALLAALEGLWWSGRHEAVRKFKCPTCLRQRPEQAPAPGRLHTTGADYPGQLMSVDHVPMKPSGGMNGVVMVVDKFSGAAFAAPVRSKTAEAVAEAFFEAIRNAMLLPGTLIADQGLEFASARFKEIMEARGIKVQLALTEHQQANFVERTVRITKGVLRTTLEALPQQAWLEVLPDVLRAINTHESASRKASAMEILTGVPPPPLISRPGYMGGWMTLEELEKARSKLWLKVDEAMHDAALKQEEAWNSKHRDLQFNVGDWVLIKSRVGQVAGNHNLQPKYEDMYVVKEKISDVTYVVHDLENPKRTQAVAVKDMRLALAEEVDPRQYDDVEDNELVIRALRGHEVRDGVRFYKVSWKGRTKTAETWESEESLAQNAGELLSRYKMLLKLDIKDDGK